MPMQITIPFDEYPMMAQEPSLIPDPSYAIAEIDLVYKSKPRLSERPKVTDSNSAAEILKAAWDQNKIDLQEQFNILMLNQNNTVLGIYRMASGGITATVSDPRLAFTAALKTGAVAMILSHNHPSHSLKPSRQDESLTQKYKEAGKMLDIKILDHIIISSEGYCSFADLGIL